MHRLSAKKHARADVKKRSRNRHRKTTLRTALKNAEVALQESDVETAQQMCKTASSLYDRAASKGVIKKATANRQKSRINRQLNALISQSA